MLEQATVKDFDEIYAIMEEAFPFDEIRSYENQKALLNKECYRILTAKDENGRTIAFVAFYDLGEILFLEHFAVSHKHRNAGLGSKILTELKARSRQKICLEVELPETDTAKRRIGFYERNGFTLNDYAYTQPSLGEGKTAIPLMLMTTRGGIFVADYPKIKALIYREVYGQKEI